MEGGGEGEGMENATYFLPESLPMTSVALIYFNSIGSDMFYYDINRSEDMVFSYYVVGNISDSLLIFFFRCYH